MENVEAAVGRAQVGASRLRSSDHVIVVSLLVGVIFLLILERGKESSVGPKEETALRTSLDFHGREFA